MRKIIRIGLPSALENIIYNVAMTLVIRFLNQMDTEGINVAARSYTAQITNLSFCVGSALAQANAIMTGWYMGAGKYEICDKQTKNLRRSEQYWRWEQNFCLQSVPRS